MLRMSRCPHPAGFLLSSRGPGLCVYAAGASPHSAWCPGRPAASEGQPTRPPCTGSFTKFVQESTFAGAFDSGWSFRCADTWAPCVGSAGGRVDCGPTVLGGAHRSWCVRGTPANGAAAWCSRSAHRHAASGFLGAFLARFQRVGRAVSRAGGTLGAGRAALPSPSGATLCEAMAGGSPSGRGMAVPPGDGRGGAHWL